MGRGSGNNSDQAKTASAKRRSKVRSSRTAARSAAPKSAAELNKSVRSQTALEAIQASGAGKHGPQGQARHKAARRDVGQKLKSGRYDEV